MGKTNAQHLKGALSANFFLRSKKKFAALFIVAVMSINGFMPNAVSANRHSAVIIAGITAYSMVVSMFKQYDKSIVAMSAKVTEGLLRLMQKQSDASEGKFAQNKAAEKQQPDAAAGQTGESAYKAVIKKNLHETKEFTPAMPVSGGFNLGLSDKIRQSAAPPGSAMPILLTFLMFIIGFISRKGIENVINTIIISAKKEIAAFQKAAVSFFAVAFGGSHGK